MHDFNPQRREILGALVGASLASALPAAAQTRSGGMLYRTLGRTGERVSAIGLGGYHMGVPQDEQDAIKLVRTAVDQGITFLDNCWDYHDGKSEVWMGKALRDGYRQKVFLMTKFDGRTKQSTARQIDESLQRLQTDRVDLMQYHENIRMEDPDRFFSAEGPLASLLRRLPVRRGSRRCRISWTRPTSTTRFFRRRLKPGSSSSNSSRGMPRKRTPSDGMRASSSTSRNCFRSKSPSCRRSVGWRPGRCTRASQP